MRVASLIASSTEIVCALGLEGALVARSHECDFPAAVVAGLPAVSRPKLDPHAPSGEIDRQVRALVADALSVYEVDRAALARLRPDVILTQVQCDVCAVSPRDVEAALAGPDGAAWTGATTGAPPRVVSLRPDRLEDVWADVRRVADALGAPARGEALVAELQARLARAAEVAARAVAAAGGRRPRVALLEWLDPLMSAGNWMPELCALAGGDCLFGVAGAHTPSLAWEDLRAADPDVVVALPCGFDLARTEAEAGALARLPGWGDLRAVRAGRVALCDGNALFNRPGPRLVESLEALVEVLHPGASFGHAGVAWRPLAPAGA